MRKILCALLISGLACLLTACHTAEKTRYEAEFLRLFDTATKVIGYADSKEEFSTFVQDLYDELEAYHRLYDIYNEYEGVNNIRTVNENAGIRPVEVDKRIIDLLKLGVEAYDLSDGQVNIAMGSVLRLWHDYRVAGTSDPSRATLPSMEVLREADRHTDIEAVIIDEEAGTVFLTDPAMSLDVGGIAKGYATEQVVLHAIERGFTDGVVSVGGNVRAFGSKGRPGTPWGIGIQSPVAGEPDLFSVHIQDRSVVSSGGHSRYYTVDGQQYHHIIDPTTLMPADYFDLVTIVCEDSGMADILSTMVFNMPFEQGLAAIEAIEDTEAVWVLKDGSIAYSSGFEALID